MWVNSLQPTLPSQLRISMEYRLATFCQKTPNMEKCSDDRQPPFRTSIDPTTFPPIRSSTIDNYGDTLLNYSEILTNEAQYIPHMSKKEEAREARDATNIKFAAICLLAEFWLGRYSRLLVRSRPGKMLHTLHHYNQLWELLECKRQFMQALWHLWGSVRLRHCRLHLAIHQIEELYSSLLGRIMLRICTRPLTDQLYAIPGGHSHVWGSDYALHLTVADTVSAEDWNFAITPANYVDIIEMSLATKSGMPSAFCRLHPLWLSASLKPPKMGEVVPSGWNGMESSYADVVYEYRDAITLKHSIGGGNVSTWMEDDICEGRSQADQRIVNRLREVSRARRIFHLNSWHYSQTSPETSPETPERNSLDDEESSSQSSEEESSSQSSEEEGSCARNLYHFIMCSLSILE